MEAPRHSDVFRDFGGIHVVFSNDEAGKRKLDDFLLKLVRINKDLSVDIDELSTVTVVFIPTRSDSRWTQYGYRESLPPLPAASCPTG